MDVFEELESWAAFVEMRRAKGSRAPFTERARERMLMELKRLHEAGEDVDKCLWTSVLNGWSGVFPVRSPRAGGGGAAPGAQMVLSAEVMEQLRPLSAGEFERSVAAKREAMAKMQRSLPGLRTGAGHGTR